MNINNKSIFIKMSNSYPLLTYEFLTFYGILQQSSIISLSDYTIYIKNLNDIAENWLFSFFKNRNISFKKSENESEIITKIYYFETIEKHFIFWLKTNIYEDEHISSTIHPYLFKLKIEEFFHLLRGWIFGSTFNTNLNSRLHNKNCFIVFLFINQFHNLLDASNLLEHFQIKHNIFSSLDYSTDDNSIDDNNPFGYLFIELDKELYDHFN